MTFDREVDLAAITMEMEKTLSSQYRKGQRRHGGNGWENRTVLGFIEEQKQELADAFIYLCWIERNVRETIGGDY